MKLVSLKLRNWRSYFGEHEIAFSTEADRPVTLLLGPNGAGKTALLNAFTWVLYGEFTEGFKVSSSLVNLEASSADPVAAITSVELNFENEGVEYYVKRSASAATQADRRKDIVDIRKAGVPASQADIDRVLPPSLKDLFFFPAESFSTASVLKGEQLGEGTSFDISKAIRSLLSGDIYKNASDDLDQAIRSNSLIPPQRNRQDTIDKARTHFEQTQAELSAAEERRDLLSGLIANAREELAVAKAVADKFDQVKVAEWEARSEEMRTQIERASQLVKKVNSAYLDIARTVHLYFAQDAVDLAVSKLNTAEQSGLIPPRIDASVLEKTIRDEKCTLCLSDLDADGIARVENLLAHVADGRVAVRGLETRTLLREYLKSHESERQRIQGEVAELSNELGMDPPAHDAPLRYIQAVVRSAISVADSKHNECISQYEEFKRSREGIATGEPNPINKLMDKKSKVDTLQAEIDSSPEKIARLKQSKEKALADYKKKSKNDEVYAQRTRAIEILSKAKEYFDEARQGLEDYGRLDFQNAINATYSDLIAKPYQIVVGEDFSIVPVLSDQTEQEIGLSQSETVLLLISFLGAMARLAPQYAEISRNKKQFVEVGKVSTSKEAGFPVVLDAPTSPLDDEYEVDVVQALPQLLPQVVLPVSAKSMEVWELISAKIGRAYILELTSQESSDRAVTWQGKSYPYSICDDSVVPARTKVVAL